MKEKNHLDFPVRSDARNACAKQLSPVVALAEDRRPVCRSFGIVLPDFNQESWPITGRQVFAVTTRQSKTPWSDRVPRTEGEHLQQAQPEGSAVQVTGGKTTGRSVYLSSELIRASHALARSLARADQAGLEKRGHDPQRRFLPRSSQPQVSMCIRKRRGVASARCFRQRCRRTGASPYTTVTTTRTSKLNLTSVCGCTRTS